MKKGGMFLIEDISHDEVFTPEDFTEEQRMFAKTTEDFIETEVMPRMAEIESLKEGVMRELLKKAGDLGLMMVDIPEDYGGLGLDRVTSSLITEKLAKGGSFSVSFGAHTGIGALPIVYFGKEEQKKMYLPLLAKGELISAYALTEAGAGSDALACKTSAVLSPDKRYYILNGEKQFITNAGFADVFIVFAKIDGEKFTAFIVERNLNGVSTGIEEKKMGIKGSSTRAVNFENVYVPVENLLGEEGKGHVIAFNILNLGRLKLGAGSVGAAKSCINEAVRYAKERVQFGKPICDFGLIKHKIGEMAIKTYVAESMVYRTASMIDENIKDIKGEDREANIKRIKGIEEFAIECSIAKIFGSEILDYVVDEGLQIFGGYGYIEDYPMERYYRNSRINRIFEGTNEINRLLIPGLLLRRALKGELPVLTVAQKVLQNIVSSTGTTEPSGEPFSTEKSILRNAKNCLLFCAGSAFQKFGEGISEEQEILGLIADMVIEIYAMESAFLRTLKSIRRNGEERSQTKILASNVYIYDSIKRVEDMAVKILSASSEGDMLRTQLSMLRKLMRHLPANTIIMRRKVADKIIENGFYNV